MDGIVSVDSVYNPTFFKPVSVHIQLTDDIIRQKTLKKCTATRTLVINIRISDMMSLLSLNTEKTRIAPRESLPTKAIA